MGGDARVLAAEQGFVEGVEWRQVLYVGDPLVHSPGEVVSMVQAAQDDAGEVDGFYENAEQGPLDAHHVPAAGRKKHISVDMGMASHTDKARSYTANAGGIVKGEDHGSENC